MNPIDQYIKSAREEFDRKFKTSYPDGSKKTLLVNSPEEYRTFLTQKLKGMVEVVRESDTHDS